MELFNLSPDTMLSFFLTLFRISIIVFLLPFFGGDSLPNMLKAALCLVLTMAVWPHLSFPGEMFPGHPISIGVMLLGELILGMVLGIVVEVIMGAVRTGGQIIGFQMGFAMVSVVDPMTGTSQAVTAHFLYMVTLLSFLVLDGHLFLLKGLTMSFEYLPPGSLLLTPELGLDLLEYSDNMFLLAIKIAAPVMAALFLVDLALALVGRASPQMNVMMLGFPVKITVGFFFLGMIFTLMSLYIEDFIRMIEPMYENIMLTGS